MSVAGLLKRSKVSVFNEKEITVKLLTTRQILGLIDGFNQLKGELGIDPATVKFDQEFFSKILTKVVGLVEVKDGVPVGAAAVALTKLAELVGLTFDDILDGSPDDLFTLASDLWEVNSTGPFGTKIRLTIANWLPRLNRMMTSLVDILEFNLHSVATAAPQFGGMNAGGEIVSPAQSSNDSAGPLTTLSTESPVVNSSESSPALDTPAEPNP
jgi:hypothetical protein